MDTNDFDVAVIGSVIAGSILGMILARHGLRVLTFEAISHPRFAIGESMVLETSEIMRAMAKNDAENYDVSELKGRSGRRAERIGSTLPAVTDAWGDLVTDKRP